MSRIAECIQDTRALTEIIKDDPSVLNDPTIKPLVRELLAALQDPSSPEGPIVSFNYVDLVDISCRMQDLAPGCGYSQGHLEYLLIQAIKAKTGVDYFEEERRRTHD